MVEHYLDTVGVTGSNPVSRTSGSESATYKETALRKARSHNGSHKKITAPVYDRPYIIKHLRRFTSQRTRFSTFSSFCCCSIRKAARIAFCASSGNSLNFSADGNSTEGEPKRTWHLSVGVPVRKIFPLYLSGSPSALLTKTSDRVVPRFRLYL